MSGRLVLALGGPPIDPYRTAQDPAKRLFSGPLDGNGRRRSVAVTIQIHENFFDRDLQAIGDRLNDADIGLVRDDAGDVVDRQASFFQSLFCGVDHRGDGLFVNFLARHFDCLQVIVDVVPRDRMARTAAGHPKDVGKFTVARDMRADEAV